MPDRNDPDVQALLARTSERRAPEKPLKVHAVDGGFALADVESYRAWWALRRAGSGIGVLKPDLVELVDAALPDAPTAEEPNRPTMVAAPKATSPVRIPLDALIVDSGLQTRAAMNDTTVAECADALLAGELLPPVIVFRDGEWMWLADGFHRVAAARQAGVADIEAIVHDGGRREALLHAVGANALHGLRRTNADKRRAVEMLIADNEWGARSDNWTAEKCGVSHPFVVRSARPPAPVTSARLGKPRTAASWRPRKSSGRSPNPWPRPPSSRSPSGWSRSSSGQWIRRP